jgi:hypothetical protein
MAPLSHETRETIYDVIEAGYKILAEMKKPHLILLKQLEERGVVIGESTMRAYIKLYRIVQSFPDVEGALSRRQIFKSNGMRAHCDRNHY